MQLKFQLIGFVAFESGSASEIAESDSDAGESKGSTQIVFIILLNMI